MKFEDATLYARQGLTRGGDERYDDHRRWEGERKRTLPRALPKLKAQMENSDSTFDKEKFERAHRPSSPGGVAVISVGAATETEDEIFEGQD